jgi:hypothetical protein
MKSHSYPSDAKSRPGDSHTYNAMKVRFSATVGQESEKGLI